MKMTRMTVCVGLLGASVLLPLGAACAAPVVTWASDPVRPDETVLVLGGGFGDAPQVEVGRLSDEAPAEAAEDPWAAVEDPRAVEVLQAVDYSLTFVVPADLAPGVFVFRIVAGGETSAARLLNAPDVWWTQGDEGRQATPGGWVRVFGKSLRLGAIHPCLRLTSATGEDIVLTGKGDNEQAPPAFVGRIGSLLVAPVAGDEYNLSFSLPPEVAPGEYRLEVHNGFGGAAAGCPAGTLTVIPPVQWKQDEFNVADFAGSGEERIRAALEAAEENGGGVVFLPRGRYNLTDQLVIPHGTVLKGQGRNLVALHWPDMEEPPPSLITGADYGLEDLSIYCSSYRIVVDADAGSSRLRLHRLLIRANMFFMLGEPGKAFRGRTAPETTTGGRVLRITSPNFQVTDCDIHTNGIALFLNPWGFRAERGPWYGVIRGNRIAYGHRGHNLECIDALIFEDNEVIGSGLAPGGNDLNTFWNNFSRNVYYARNRIHGMYGLDREMLTLDAGGGAYFGKVAQVDGVRLTLAEDPQFRDYHPTTHHTDYRGGVVMILDGNGAGQYRRVTANEGREWEVDRPWDIPPDETSIIQIGPHRGRHLFIGNDYSDGGAFQLYGAALDTIVAKNTGARMDGFFAWGLNPHGWGWQPAWFCQFLDNDITEGNGFGHRAWGDAFLGALASNNNEIYPGPLVRGVVFRRNVLHSNARLRLSGTVDGAVVEHCTVRHNDVGVVVGAGTRNVLLRGNAFESVDEPYSGEGLEGALIVPE